MDKSIKLAQAIENAMKARGFNRIDFAHLMAVQPSIITRWLSGHHNFTIATLFKIEVALETQIIYIIKS